MSYSIDPNVEEARCVAKSLCQALVEYSKNLIPGRFSFNSKPVYHLTEEDKAKVLKIITVQLSPIRGITINDDTLLAKWKEILQTINWLPLFEYRQDYIIKAHIHQFLHTVVINSHLGTTYSGKVGAKKKAERFCYEFTRIIAEVDQIYLHDTVGCQASLDNYRDVWTSLKDDVGDHFDRFCFMIGYFYYLCLKCTPLFAGTQKSLQIYLCAQLARLHPTMLEWFDRSKPLEDEINQNKATMRQRLHFSYYFGHQFSFERLQNLSLYHAYARKHCPGGFFRF